MMVVTLRLFLLLGLVEAFSPLISMRRSRWSIGGSCLQATQRTLASEYVISAEGDSWKAYAIDSVVTKPPAQGEKAMVALQEDWDIDIEPAFTLSVEVQDDRATVSLKTRTNHDKSLISILSRVMIQWAAARERLSVSSITVPNDDSFEVVNLQTQEGVLKLFESLIGSTQKLELSEMVDQDGNPLGMVPRKLVHKENLLHRGIGMVVTKDASVLSPQCTNFPALYVHRRTESKRIFPSLYDMFVGGVSTAGEDSKLTAAREVAEELGLERALVDPNMLSDPLFTCTVCTSYNRCVVTMFCCTFDSNKDSIKWQEDEVAWGDFVDYETIVASADFSIQRLLHTGKWPGCVPLNLQDRLAASLVFSKKDGIVWQEWDYVPDGLLVWEAWLDWLNQGK